MENNENNTRMFDDYTQLTVEKVADKINALAEQNIHLVEKSETMQKWLTLPMVEMANDDNRLRFIEVVRYIDELLIPMETKVEYIFTLSTLLIDYKINIASVDANDLFLLVSYLSELSLSEYKDALTLLNKEELLLAIRNNALDVERRLLLLTHFFDQAKESKINFQSTSDIASFQNQIINVLKDKTSSEILGLESYMAGPIDEEVAFRDSVQN